MIKPEKTTVLRLKDILIKSFVTNLDEKTDVLEGGFIGTSITDDAIQCTDAC